MTRLYPPKIEKYNEKGLIINDLLTKNNISRRQLAIRFGISGAYMTDILQGNRPASRYIPAIIYWLEHTDEEPELVKEKFKIKKRS